MGRDHGPVAGQFLVVAESGRGQRQQRMEPEHAAERGRGEVGEVVAAPPVQTLSLIHI